VLDYAKQKWKMTMTKKLTFVLVVILSFIVQSGCINVQPPDKSVHKGCLPINSDPSLLQIEGNLILSGEETYILTGEATRTNIPFFVTPDYDYKILISDFHVSPDATKAAFIETYYRKSDGELSYVSEKLKILEFSGNEIEVSDWQPGIEKLISWFDNDRLLISPKNYSDGTIILLNPLLNDRQTIPPPFSDAYNLDPIAWYRGTNPLPVYNSSLSLVFYLRNSINGMEYVLKNLETEKILWFATVHNPSNEPKWSPDGKEILVAIPRTTSSDFEFYSIDRYGNETVLTNFSSVYSYSYIWGFSWSPNGNYVGFWLDGRSNEDEYNPRFAIIDLNSLKVTDFCIGKGGGPIIWSPGGNQVTFSVDDETFKYTVVIDLQKKIAIKVADQEYPIGWLVNSPQH